MKAQPRGPADQSAGANGQQAAVAALQVDMPQTLLRRVHRRSECAGGCARFSRAAMARAPPGEHVHPAVGIFETAADLRFQRLPAPKRTPREGRRRACPGGRRGTGRRGSSRPAQVGACGERSAHRFDDMRRLASTLRARPGPHVPAELVVLQVAQAAMDQFGCWQMKYGWPGRPFTKEHGQAAAGCIGGDAHNY